MTARHLIALIALVIAAGCGDDDERPAAPAQKAPAATTTATTTTPAKPVARKDQPACDALRESDVAATVLRTSGRRLDDIGTVEVERTDSDETSSCGYYAGPHDDVAVKLIIDRAAKGDKRFWYRMEELNQRSANWDGPDPRVVKRVGQDRGYGGGAFWVPSTSKLTAYRDGRMLTLIFFVPGVGDRESSAAAADLARTAYRRMFGNRPPAPPRSLQGRDPHP